MSQRGRALRWYPEPWRRRYGEELLSLLEDTYGTGRLPTRVRLSLARSGTVQRSRALLGTGTSGAAGTTAGASLVLWGWAAFVLAGAGFAKIAENFVVPGRAAQLPRVGYDLVYGAAVAGAVIVVTAAVACAPGLLRLLRHGGWRRLRGGVLLAAVTSLLALAAGTAMVAWAHGLSVQQRNGGLGSYSLLALLLAVATGAAIAAWTGVATTAFRRAGLPDRVLRGCGLLAVVLTGTMVLGFAGTLAWWAAVASRAPWFFTLGAPGSAGQVVTWPLCAVGVLMSLGLAAGGCGAVRVINSRRS